MSAADLISGEEERGELHISFVRPVSRHMILLGKLTAMIVYCFCCLLGFAVISTIVSFIGDPTNINLLVVLLSHAATIVPIIMLCCMAAFFHLFCVQQVWL